MAPKKSKEEPKERPILGRFRSHLKIGIVGVPNVGKSTLFNVLTKMGIPAENFPFCTIDPNHNPIEGEHTPPPMLQARVNVPDERFNWLCSLFQPKSEVPAFLEIVDIAGLVKGAAAGEGLGNAFLSHIQEVDGIMHVCRAFEDADVVHVEDRVDPVEDLEIIHSELRAKDIATIQRNVDELDAREKRGLTKDQKEERDHGRKVLEFLNEGTDVRFGDWNVKETDYLNSMQLISAKPAVYLINLTEKAFIKKKSKWLPKVHEWVSKHGGEPILPFSGKFEAKIFDMPEDERAAYCKENEVISMLPKIITMGFKAIRLIYFFTAGEDEVKCWQIRRGAKAPQGAGTIHTDFERGFICAEVMHYDELKELGSESAVKAAGKYRQEGKNYVLQDGDICFFKFNVTASAKK